MTWSFFLGSLKASQKELIEFPYLFPTKEVSQGSAGESHEVMDAKVFCKIQRIPPMQAIIGRKQKDEFKSQDSPEKCVKGGPI